MASSSGTSSGSASLNQTLCSNGDFRVLMDQRKRKRMISNRESARRSRIRKQKQLDDVIAQSAQLTAENQQIAGSIAITTQLYLGVEAENSVLRAQVGELRHRLESLNDIISFLSPMGGGHAVPVIGQFGFDALINHHPIMTSPADLFHC